MIIKRIKRLFILSIIFFLLSIISLSFIPFMEKLIVNEKHLYLLAALFWLGVVLAIIILFIIRRIIKQYISKDKSFRYDNSRHIPGIISIHFSKVNIVVYLFLIAGLTFIVIDLLLDWLMITEMK